MSTTARVVDQARAVTRGPRIPDDRLWTVHDVSYYLGVPVATLYQWRCANRGPVARRVGRYIRYRAADVFAWLDEGADNGNE